MASYRKAEFDDPEFFLAGVCAVFAAYPQSIGRQVIDPLKGLPGRLKFPPHIADVKIALDEAMNRRRMIAYRAQWMLDERAKREAEAKRRAEIDAVSPERKAQLAAALQGALDHADVSDRKRRASADIMNSKEKAA